MTRPPQDILNCMASLPRKVSVSIFWGGLVVLAGFSLSLSLGLATARTAQAQATGSTAIPIGVDIIPTDLPAHASEPVSSNRPRSLLPGTIPIDDSIEEDSELPSLATQYYHTLTGTAPRTVQRKAPDVVRPSTSQKSPSSQPVNRPPTQDTVTVARTETITYVPVALPDDPSGKYLIQLGAFHDTITAESYWASFMVRYPDLSKSHDKQIVTAYVGSKGIFHRLQLTGFADFESAKQQCRRLKTDGTDCFATRH